MTRQYKNPFEDPDADFYGKKVKDYKIPERKKTPLEKKVPNIEDYIYVPTSGLYVAKKRSLHGLSWEDTHKELHKKSMQMLTIRQFIDFILHLKQNKSSIPDAKKILDEILTGVEPLKGEWLDAKFSEETASQGFRGASTFPIGEEIDADDFGCSDYDKPSVEAEKLYISYNHRIVKGKLVAKKIEPLKKCLMQDCDIDLKSCNKQGLPTKEGSDIMYGFPGENYVAGFCVGPNWARLFCRLDPEPHLGVRAARKK